MDLRTSNVLARISQILQIFIEPASVHMPRLCRTARIADEDRRRAGQHVVGVRLRRYFCGLWAVDHDVYLVGVRNVMAWLQLLTATPTIISALRQAWTC